jgi:hypothetical protein
MQRYYNYFSSTGRIIICNCKDQAIIKEYMWGLEHTPAREEVQRKESGTG